MNSRHLVVPVALTCVLSFLATPGLVPSAWSAEPEAQKTEVATVRSDYQIGVEDALRVSVWGEKDLNQEVRVRPDGKISYPLVNEVTAEGLTPEQLRQELTTRLSRFIRDPNVTVVVSEINSFRVYVLGDVRSQGAIGLRRPTRLLQVIATAGGLGEFAKGTITLIREEGGVERRVRVNYKRLLTGESDSENVLLKRGDTLIVE